MVEMPVLFSESPIHPLPNKALAYTTDHVNSIINGTTVVAGKAYGPSVDYDGNGAKDILEEYAKAMFIKAGYSNIIFTDARWYHNDEGLAHCGTNVLRAIPGYSWWTK